MKISLLAALMFACGLTACTEAANAEVAAGPATKPAAPATPSVERAPLVTGLPDFSALVDQEGKAVVNISTSQIIRSARNQFGNGEEDPFEFFRRFGFPVPRGVVPNQPREERAQSLGSGFIIARDGYLLTNAHVVAEADEITVRLNDKREFKAKVIGSDARTDVALLKIEAKDLPVVRVGSSEKLRVGEWVVAIGSPFGLDSTVTAGIVSAKGRNLPAENYVPFIQTDAAVNPGNSGGPLFNVRGEVVGINSQIFSRSGGYMGLSFAIPIDAAMQIADQLKQNGKVTRGRIGVGIQPLSDDLARDFGLKDNKGALISNVDPEGPAAKAGFKAGDVILKFNGTTIEESTDLPRVVGDTAPGKTVPVDIWRDKSSKRLNVTVAEMDQPADGRAQQRERKRESKDNEAMNKSGLTVREAPPAMLRQFGIKFGLQVMAAQGPAATAGIQQGDVIVGVGGEDLKSFAQLDETFAKAKPGSSVPLRIRRGEASLFVSLKLPEKGDKSND
ncbi:DegQ family serine endoprotease [Chitinimonas sp. BJYL2]|uniref:DegQ family serine endoprotease n=1 Tax=Chitinimonas sp. BJYL2 TaxID=2976696 RepID=UPI0022B2FE23|nr:DegQ family serine endoprotease [Chitinimonas sp. BJYL2]